MGGDGAAASADGDQARVHANGAAHANGTAGDERSSLWATHRALNEQAWRKPNGVMFRAEVMEVAESNVTVRWVFPESTPGDSSAWLGLWDAAEFNWAAFEPRPRYMRYKSLTSTRQEGVTKFSAKEWAGLPDGEYVFSIDTGAIPCGAGDSRSYCISQRLKIEGGLVAGLVGRAHGAPLPPINNLSAGRVRTGVGTLKSAGSGAGRGENSDSDDDDDDDDARQAYMFAVPLLEYEIGSDEPADIKKVYTLVDRLSYLDWGLRSEDEVSGKRTASMASHNTDWNGCIVHDGAMWGEAAHGTGNSGPKTARTSEGYGEATCATAEKLVRILAGLTQYVPAMGGWAGTWNLDADATFLDIGSGYGKVVFHAKLNCGCRAAVGIECVAKRAEISTFALQGLYGELDRARLANDLLKGVSFEAADATQYECFHFSHIYIFDRVFSQVTLEALGKVLQRSPFYVMISSRKPQVWWDVGLSKIQPIGKMRFKTTGREGMTCFIYINSHFIPGL